jgi:hypothetical protein
MRSLCVAAVVLALSVGSAIAAPCRSIDVVGSWRAMGEFEIWSRDGILVSTYRPTCRFRINTNRTITQAVCGAGDFGDVFSMEYIGTQLHVNTQNCEVGFGIGDLSNPLPNALEHFGQISPDKRMIVVRVTGATIEAAYDRGEWIFIRRP